MRNNKPVSLPIIVRKGDHAVLAKFKAPALGRIGKRAFLRRVFSAIQRLVPVFRGGPGSRDIHGSMSPIGIIHAIPAAA